METIVTAKDRQAAEANKNATILLEEIDKERQVEENRKAQAAKKRERRKRKRKEKLEKEKESKSVEENTGLRQFEFHPQTIVMGAPVFIKKPSKLVAI